MTGRLLHSNAQANALLSIADGSDILAQFHLLMTECIGQGCSDTGFTVATREGVGHSEITSDVNSVAGRVRLDTLRVCPIQLADFRGFVGYLGLSLPQPAPGPTPPYQANFADVAAALAHELNQPLTAVASYAAAASASYRDESVTARQLSRELIDKAALQARRAGEIARRMRDLSQYETASRAVFDLRDIVAESVDMVLASRPEQRSCTTLSLAPAAAPVRVDRVAIAQIVVNLVRNALEAMDASGAHPASLRVAVGRATGAGGGMELRISDTGVGLPDNFAFCGLALRQQRSRKTGGLGLGLMISQRIAAHHGGRITIAPGEGGVGTVAVLSLPAAPCQPDAPAAP